MHVDSALASEPPEAEVAYVRPTATLPLGHLIRISMYWLGLTAIDGAVGLFNQNRLNFGAIAVDPNEVGRILFRQPYRVREQALVVTNRLRTGDLGRLGKLVIERRVGGVPTLAIQKQLGVAAEEVGDGPWRGVLEEATAPDN